LSKNNKSIANSKPNAAGKKFFFNFQPWNMKGMPDKKQII
jgi:hypothetical protein